MTTYTREDIITILTAYRRLPMPQQKLLVLLLNEYTGNPTPTSTSVLTRDSGYDSKISPHVLAALKAFERKGWCKIEYINAHRYYVIVNENRIINDLLNYPFTQN